MSFKDSVVREFLAQPEGWLVGVQVVKGEYIYYCREDTPSYRSMDFYRKSRPFATPNEAFRELYRYLGREGVDWWVDTRE